MTITTGPQLEQPRGQSLKAPLGSLSPLVTHLHLSHLYFSSPSKVYHALPFSYTTAPTDCPVLTGFLHGVDALWSPGVFHAFVYERSTQLFCLQISFYVHLCASLNSAVNSFSLSFSLLPPFLSAFLSLSSSSSFGT